MKLGRPFTSVIREYLSTTGGRLEAVAYSYLSHSSSICGTKWSCWHFAASLLASNTLRMRRASEKTSQQLFCHYVSLEWRNAVAGTYACGACRHARWPFALAGLVHACTCTPMEVLSYYSRIHTYSTPRVYMYLGRHPQSCNNSTKRRSPSNSSTASSK